MGGGDLGFSREVSVESKESEFELLVSLLANVCSDEDTQRSSGKP